jgi:hypothetical protein
MEEGRVPIYLCLSVCICGDVFWFWVNNQDDPFMSAAKRAEE